MTMTYYEPKTVQRVHLKTWHEVLNYVEDLRYEDPVHWVQTDYYFYEDGSGDLTLVNEHESLVVSLSWKPPLPVVGQNHHDPMVMSLSPFD